MSCLPGPSTVRNPSTARMRIPLFTAACLLLPMARGGFAHPDAGQRPDGLADAGCAAAGSSDGGAPDAGPTKPVAPPLPPPRPLPPIQAGMGRVSGRITLNGPPPPLAPAVSVGRDPNAGVTATPVSAQQQQLAPTASSRDVHFCGMTQPDLSLQIGINGGLLETVLWAPDGPPPPKGARPVARVEIEGCRFIPHVLATTDNAELTLVNRDGLYHNVTGAGIATFNLALVLKDHDLPMHLKKPGLLTLESKLRAWMKGYVQSLPTTAWSMTDTDGSYFIDLPPGKHQLKLWHERLGEREETVDIAAGETTLKDFQLTPK
jgi:hypothetical protein